MEVTIKEINFYNSLVEKGRALPIYCPFDKEENFKDIIIAKVDENDKVCFYCLSCKSTFYPGINLIQKIKGYISLATS
jgi:hypothetical protein